MNISENEPSAKCRSCLESINSKAIACKYCGHYQSRNILSPRHPAFYLIATLVLIMSAGYIAEYFVSNKAAEIDKYLEGFEPDSSNIHISSDSIASKSPFKILGKITNKDNNSWAGVQIEALVYDDEDKLIEILKGYIPGKIKPNQSVAFRVPSSNCSADVELKLDRAHRYEIKVKDARYVSPE